MSIENQPNAPADPVEADAKVIGDAATDLGAQRARELKDDGDKSQVVAREQALEAELAQEKAKDAALTADAADARSREEADKKTIADADARLNRGEVPGPGPAPQPPRPRVG